MATLMFYWLCIGSALALLSLIAMMTAGKNDRRFILGVIIALVSGLSLVVPVTYANVFQDCPCKAVVIGLDGKTQAEIHNIKGVFQGRYNQVTFYMGGLNYASYNVTQVRWGGQ